MKKLQLSIIIVIFIIVILIGAIILINKNEEDKTLSNNISNVQENTSSEENNTESSEDLSRLEYTILNRAVTTYIQTINQNNSIYIDRENKKIMDDEEKNKYVLNLLSQSYIDKNKIDSNNLEKHIKLLDEQLMYIPLKMKRIVSSKVKTYVVEGSTINMNYEQKETIRLIVNIDYQNKTFSVEPTVDEYDKIYSVDESFDIEKKGNNEYTTKGMSTENFIKDLLNNFKRMILSNVELAYNKLDKEYREKRFGSEEEFQKYIDNNRDVLKELQLSQYLVNNYEDYVEYVCKDKYQNLYIFHLKSPMEYSVTLDTYTILTEKYKSEYNKGSTQQKVQMCIDQFRLMINNQDFRAAYNVLDENFKNNYFNTQEDFEEYLKSKMYKYNKIDFTSFDVKGKTYICGVNISDLTEGQYKSDNKGTGGSNYIYEWNFMVQLNENYEFTLSFEVD